MQNYYHHGTPSPGLSHKLQNQQQDGWGRHPGVFSGGGPSSGNPYAQYPPPPQHHHPHHPHHPHHQQSFSQSHQSPSPMHQQVGGLLIGNLGNNSGNGAHSSPPIQHANADDTVHWQQQIVKYTACRQASAPHYRARAAAIAGRMSNNNKSAISITDPNSRPSSTKPNGLHKKDMSISGHNSDSDDGRSPAMGHPSAISSPVVVGSDPTSQQPWSGLDLGGIHLKTLAPSLFAFSHVTSLYINHNSLTSLPAAVSQLRALTVLDATGNQLRSIPAELGMITSLKELLLFDNLISDLPPELGTLYQLDTLGIAGNPLPESLRLILEKDGTQALISYLRDSCPVPLPPPDREWITVEADNGLSQETAPESFTLLCYNILCEWYAPAATYPYTPGWALAWEYRKELILQEVMGCGADVICLQEVDEEQYNDTFLANLSKEGYEGAFFPKTRARTMGAEEKKRVDGCATFWKANKYNLVEKRVVEFNQVALQRPDMRKSDDMFNRVMSKDNIAVVCLFENPASGTRLIVANCHLTWDPTFRDVKLVQVAMLMEEIEKIAGHFAKYPPPLLGAERVPGPTYSDATKIPLIVCGDFNSSAESGVYQFLSSGSAPKDHEDFMEHLYGAYTTDGLSHSLNLKSAYSTVGEIKMTNFVPTFKGAIDYIWYSTNSLAVTSLLGDVDPAYLSKVVGFPNAHFPSDHVPIFADFKLKPPPSTARAVTHSNDRF